MVMDNIHKYFYMIAFTAYMREMAALAISTATDEDKVKNGLTGGKISTPGDQLKLTKSFASWMGEHGNLRTIVDEGKGTSSGRGTSPPPPSPTWSPLPPATSRPTLARSSTTSTRRPTPCSPTCPRVTTRSVPSTGSPPRPS